MVWKCKCELYHFVGSEFLVQLLLNLLCILYIYIYVLCVCKHFPLILFRFFFHSLWCAFKFQCCRVLSMSASKYIVHIYRNYNQFFVFTKNARSFWVNNKKMSKEKEWHENMNNDDMMMIRFESIQCGCDTYEVLLCKNLDDFNEVKIFKAMTNQMTHDTYDQLKSFNYFYMSNKYEWTQIFWIWIYESVWNCEAFQNVTNWKWKMLTVLEHEYFQNKNSTYQIFREKFHLFRISDLILILAETKKGQNFVSNANVIYQMFGFLNFWCHFWRGIP